MLSVPLCGQQMGRGSRVDRSGGQSGACVRCRDFSEMDMGSYLEDLAKLEGVRFEKCQVD